MDILKFILEDGLIMIPVLYILINIIKGMDIIDKKYLPCLALVFSIAITPLILMGGYNANNIVQAILIAGATVFTHEVTEIGED